MLATDDMPNSQRPIQHEALSYDDVDPQTTRRRSARLQECKPVTSKPEMTDHVAPRKRSVRSKVEKPLPCDDKDGESGKRRRGVYANRNKVVSETLSEDDDEDVSKKNKRRKTQPKKTTKKVKLKQLPWSNQGSDVPLPTLPLEILDNILAHLPHPIDFIHLSKSCKLLNHSITTSKTWSRFLPPSQPPKPQNLTWKTFTASLWNTFCHDCFTDIDADNVVERTIDIAGDDQCWTCFVRGWMVYNASGLFIDDGKSLSKGKCMSIYDLTHKQMSLLSYRTQTTKNGYTMHLYNI
ncbi:hypothetical protein BC829DRAFT_485916 [Chytridium lagenaria]|nr:hypothetical protein BC829DRAFT_485916 [Chytridium lagenaria]